MELLMASLTQHSELSTQHSLSGVSSGYTGRKVDWSSHAGLRSNVEVVTRRAGEKDRRPVRLEKILLSEC